MRCVLIDTSEDWVGIVIVQDLILKILNKELRRRYGKSVHMNELRLGEKFSALRVFNKLLSRRGVELYSLKLGTNISWTELLERIMQRGISTFYVDKEVEEQLRQKVRSIYFKRLDIYVSKDVAQCADILAYGDSHHDFIRNIWKDVEIRRGDSG